MIIKRGFILSLILILIIACSAPKTDDKEVIDTPKSNVLRVATNLPFEPMEFMENGNMVGLDIDLINSIADELGKDVEIVNYEREEMFNAVRNNDADMMIAAIKITPEKSQEFLFSSPYLEAGQVIVAKTIDTEIEDYKFYCPDPGVFAKDVNIIDDETEELIAIEYDAPPFKPLDETLAEIRAEIEAMEAETEEEESEETAELTEEEAEAIALAAYPGTVNIMEVEKFNKRIAYKFEIDTDAEGELDVFVDKETGEILGTED